MGPIGIQAHAVCSCSSLTPFNNIEIGGRREVTPNDGFSTGSWTFINVHIEHINESVSAAHSMVPHFVDFCGKFLSSYCKPGAVTGHIQKFDCLGSKGRYGWVTPFSAGLRQRAKMLRCMRKKPPKPTVAHGRRRVAVYLENRRSRCACSRLLMPRSESGQISKARAILFP
jgi:hypothetical protein